MMLTDAELADLERLAKAVPQGPYRIQQHGEKGSYIYLNCFPCECWVDVTGSNRLEMADFVVAAYPGAILALVAEVRAAREAKSNESSNTPADCIWCDNTGHAGCWYCHACKRGEELRAKEKS